MSDTKTLCDITNSTFRFNISVELFETRDKFCPVKGSIKCANDCPIYREYYSRGFSCSGALDKYPGECKKLMAGNKPFSAAGTAVLREVYAKIGIECINKTPVEFFDIKYKTKLINEITEFRQFAWMIFQISYINLYIAVRLVAVGITMQVAYMLQFTKRMFD